MSEERIVIVGGGAAGHAAARGYRGAGGAGRVIVISDDDRPPYERPVVSKELLRGQIEAGEAALDPLRDVEIRFAHATALDTNERTVTLEGGEKLAYDGCVLATGSEPVRIGLTGADNERVFVLRTVADSLRLAAAVGPNAHACVIGSGFIACEAAVSLRAAGAQVTMMGMEPVPQAQRLGAEVGERIAGWLSDAGVRLEMNREVTAMPGADVVLLATGASPRLDLARSAGLRFNDDGSAVATDAAMRTTADRVHAAGDIAAASHPLAGRPLRVEHWDDALAHGEVAGATLAGKVARWDAVPGFWSTIGAHTLKHAAWGDGWADCRIEDHGAGAWSAWYTDSEGAVVAVLTHDRDEDYEHGRELLATGT